MAAMADGLTSEQDAKAVKVPRSTLYRREKEPEPKSRGPHRPRGKQWTSEPARAVEDLRNDDPMWSKRKIAVLLGGDGFACSVSTVGRILAYLVKRGAVVPVPTLRRSPAARRIRLNAKQRYARRLPKGRTTPLADKPRRSISKLSAKANPRRLIRPTRFLLNMQPT